ncbi:MAG: class I SAM-dependent methyltransferase [Planctomycetota bacterium]
MEGVVEALPFPDDTFDVVLGVLTLHHWSDIARGLEECRRVARERVVLLTWDPEDPGFWLTQDYFPAVLELDRSIFPTMTELAEVLPGAREERLPLPADCIDGFLCAYWRRPEAYLIPQVRRSMSTLMRIGPLEPGLERLRADLERGAWLRRNGHLLDLEEFELGYRLVTAPAR